MKSIKVKSYAKLNLSLQVKKKRDDGYHEVDMIMQEISLHDIVNLEKKERGILVKTDKEYIPDDERNIAYQAARLFLENTRVDSGIYIKIKKNIPVCAGLGGGSSNAAYVLKGMNKLFNTHYSDKELEQMASEIGSDVPFFIKGKTQRCMGRGEILNTINTNIKFNFLILKPNINCSTGEIYNNLNIENINNSYAAMMEKELRGNNEGKVLELLNNDLEKSAFDLYPNIKEYIVKLKETKALSVMMTGSGSSVFGIYSNKYKALLASEKLKRICAQKFIATTK